MKRAYVLRRDSKRNVFQLDMVRPYEALYCAIFGEDSIEEFFYSEYKDMQNVIDCIIDTLTNREIKVLLYRFGFLGEFYSLRDTGRKLGCSGEQVRLVERKALRKMRHPSRSKKLRSHFPNHGDFFEESKSSIDYKKIIYRELEKQISGAIYKYDFLDKIVEKNKIRFEFPITKKYMQVGIEELKLSVQTYNCLKRAEIHTIGELLSLTSKDTMRIRNFGRKHLDELMELFKEMNIEWNSTDETKISTFGNKYTTVDFWKEKECVKYKLNCKNKEELVECLYEIMSQECSEWKPLIEYNLSAGLLNLLLLKGYFFVEKVLDECEQIIKDFSLSGYDAYAEELEDFVKAMKKYISDVEHSSIKIIWLRTDIAKKIISKKPESYSDLFTCFVTDDESLNTKYKEILHAHMMFSKVIVDIVPLANQTDRYHKYFKENLIWEDIQIDEEIDEDILDDEWELL